MKLKLSLHILFLFIPLLPYAQDISSKDQVIEALMINPNDTLLWECYIGKSWNSMNIYEKEQCQELSVRFGKNLKEQLEKEKMSWDQLETDSFDSDVDSLESTATKLVSNDFLKEEKKLENDAKTAAEASIAELKAMSQNTQKNLPLIEDFIEKKTSELNIEYVNHNSENGEEILDWIKMYGQKIYIETYKEIIESHGQTGE